MDFCQDVLERLESEPDLLRRVITGNESWIVVDRLRSLTPPRPKKAKESKVKVLLIAFFDVWRIVHWELFSQRQTFNQHVFKEILQRLLSSVHEKRRELWQDNAWLLHYENVPAHNTLSVRQFLAEKNVAMLEPPPYSPDLAPCDFFPLS